MCSLDFESDKKTSFNKMTSAHIWFYVFSFPYKTSSNLPLKQDTNNNNNNNINNNTCNTTTTTNNNNDNNVGSIR